MHVLSSIAAVIVLSGLVVMSGALYLLPVLIGWIRRVPDLGSVAVINVLLGWTLIGWAAALALALRSARPRAAAVQVVQNFPAPPHGRVRCPARAGPGRPGRPRPGRTSRRPWSCRRAQAGIGTTPDLWIARDAPPRSGSRCRCGTVRCPDGIAAGVPAMGACALSTVPGRLHGHGADAGVPARGSRSRRTSSVGSGGVGSLGGAGVLAGCPIR